jgi:molybdopterin converting factor subunit 1
MKTGKMLVKVLFFGMLRDLVGHSEQELKIADDACLKTVFDHYALLHPQLRKMSSSVLLAHNQKFATPDTTLSDGDEVAFMPPVSGGTTGGVLPLDDTDQDPVIPFLKWVRDKRGFYGLTHHPINVDALKQQVASSRAGALLTFEGVVRDNSCKRRTFYLDYDCYVPLALRTMQRLGHEVLQKNEIEAIAIVHRIGRLEIGEASVVITISAAHRQVAYKASLEAINKLKKTVPVWKKEYFEDGEIWVGGELDVRLSNKDQKI